jgi:Zn ribbon nucleic-acid-binding protein
MRNRRHHTQAGFSIMPLPVFLVWGVVVGWIIHRYTDSVLLSIIGGVASFPATVWILDLIFNNPVALKLQNYAGNHACPSCHQKYDSYRSMPTENDLTIIECLKCGAKHKFDRRYQWKGEVAPPTQNQAEQAAP